MKIHCEKCGADITTIVNQNLEKNKIGNYICEKCNQKQRRYISETDLLIYLSFQEIMYFVLSFITSIIFNTYKLTWYIAVFFLVMIIAAAYITANFKNYLYSKAPLKQKTMYKPQNEDETKIARSIRWQFYIFFVLIISFFTEIIEYWLFIAVSLIVIASTIIKAILSAKKE